MNILIVPLSCLKCLINYIRMNNNRRPIFHLFRPGDHQVDGDWCSFPIPTNIEVGSDTMIDSSSIFKKFFSELPLGLKIGDHVTLQGSELATEKNGYIE